MSGRRGLLAGLAAALLGMSAGAPQIVAAFGSTRTISLYHIHTKETLTVTYKEDGKYIPEALKKINWLMRDWRENEEIAIDPKAIDILWEMHTELGSKEPIHIICGYRSEKTNGMLRKTRGGQAKKSYHIQGKAIDAAFPDIPVKQMRYSALIRERGGVGYYPTSGIPFVHVDSGPVRAWPRLPRYELALLFPNGHTKHRPTSGGPLTPEDVRVARSRHKDLARQVAAFFDLRDRPKAPVALAQAEPAQTAQARPDGQPAATPPWPPAETRVAALAPVASAPETAPELKAAPQLVRASLGGPPPLESDRGRLNQLVQLASLTPDVSLHHAPDRNGLEQLVKAALQGPAPVAAPRPPALEAKEAAKKMRQLAALAPEAPRTQSPTATDAAASGWSNGWAPAPEFDEDHPEELSYRPFPVAPLLTESPSADDVVLVKLVHPDIARTLELLDDRQIVLPLRLRPGDQVAEVMWAQQFRGDAVNVDLLEEAARERAPASPLASRTVKTTAR